MPVKNQQWMDEELDFAVFNACTLNILIDLR